MEGSEFQPSALILDSDLAYAEAVARVMRRQGYSTVQLHQGREALIRIGTEPFDIVLVDLDLPEDAGFEVLRAFRYDHTTPLFVALSGSQDVERAVRALQLGASDFILKPTDPEGLRVKLLETLGRPTIRRSVARPPCSRSTFVCESPRMRTVLRLAERGAKRDRTAVLLLGESGVGKEVIASHIHHSSPRADGPFIRVNLAALASSTLEAELFGARKGAYTGATERKGLFRAAHGGTLLLDELCEFDIRLQAKLLRALETQRFFPVGSDEEVRTDVRVLAATNVEPQDAIESGRLRADLYYRLSTLTLNIPPLRQRREDILPLAEFFLSRFCEESALNRLEFSARAEAALVGHDWPGNVRQLRNAVERAVVVSDGPLITTADLGLAEDELTESMTEEDSLSLEGTRQQAVECIERLHIRRVMRLAGGSPGRAATMLGVSRSTLWTKLRRYGMA